MELMYCGDANVEKGLFISAYSVVRCAKEDVSVHILTASVGTDAISEDFAGGLEKMLKSFRPGSRVRLHDITEVFRDQLPGPNMSTRFTPCCMLRLYSDGIEEIPDRVLYLDCDVVALGDVGELYHRDMREKELAGVPDHYGSWFFSSFFGRFDYLNSGVLLMDMKKLRESGDLTRARELCQTKKMFMPDQSAINKICRSKLKLPRRFNEQRSEKKKNTLLRHFTTTFRFFPKFYTVTVKPWEPDRIKSVLKTERYDRIISEALEAYDIIAKAGG